MGKRGPIPKRDVARAGHRATSQRAESFPPGTAVPNPSAPPEYDAWDNFVREIFDSFEGAPWMEASDWAVLKMTCEVMDRNLKGSRYSADLHRVCMVTLDSIGATEGGRRRMRVEVDRPQTDPSERKSTASARLGALRAVKDA